MGDTDIVWTKTPTHEPTTLITFYQGEQGFASFVAGMGLIGDEEPVAKIFSKLHSVDPMNTFPDPTFPEWRVYERRNDDGRRYFILRLSHTYIVGANMTKAWLYNYPVFRDITMHLSSYGVDESLYLTSHLMGGYPAAEQAYVPDDQLVVFDYLNPEEDAYLTDGSRIEEDMLIAPPCWMFANIFGNFNHNVIKGNWVAICSHDENVFVNERGSDMLINFLSDVHALGVNHAKVGEIYEMITQVEHTFGGESRLTVSGQLQAEIAALALTDVYTFGPTFRAENSNTSRHLAEFWMVEPEMAFCDLDGARAIAEDFLKHLFRSVLEACPEDMRFFAERIDRGVLDVLEHIIESPFETLSYTEAVQVLERSGKSFEFPVQWGVDLQSEHERYLTEEHVGRPVVVTDYPAAIKAFYMYLNDDERTVRAMDVLVPRIGEIIGGSQREDRHDVLQRRIAEAGLPEDDYWWYLDLRRHGSVPHAGFGLGFERVVQFMTGMANIRDVIPFPRVPGSAAF